MIQLSGGTTIELNLKFLGTFAAWMFKTSIKLKVAE